VATKIEWCEETVNYITGCEAISEACKNCYAQRMAKRLAGRHGYPQDDPFRPGTLHPEKLRKMLTWRKPRQIFMNSMGDTFHEAVSQGVLDDMWWAMKHHAGRPRHTYIVLTKRAERMRDYMVGLEAALARVGYLVGAPKKIADWWPGVWMGVTAENQRRADERMPVLARTPAAVRFVSVEPMLGPVNLDRWLCPPHQEGRSCTGEKVTFRGPLDWVICGGETGPGARPMDLGWARELRDRCAAASVPFFFKKVGGNVDVIPEDLMVREYPG
jgi:protein gp37